MAEYQGKREKWEGDLLTRLHEVIVRERDKVVELRDTIQAGEGFRSTPVRLERADARLDAYQEVYNAILTHDTGCVFLAK